jgi:hypothetical protein
MSRTRVFLVASALVWLPYGLFCLARPDFLREAAGVAVESATGRTEVRAMYGGLQAALGILVVLGVADRRRERGVLTVLAVLCAGLFSARLIGVLIDGGFSSYTASGLVFEGGSTLAALALLGGRPGSAP